MEQTLPFDVARCVTGIKAMDEKHPKCKSCMRLSDHPWQTFDQHRQAFFNHINPATCTLQIPVSEGGVK